MKRLAFFISDGTGITAETLGHSLLSQFPSIAFKQITLPYIDTEEKARETVEEINLASVKSDNAPLIISSIVNPDIRAILATAEAESLDLFERLLPSLEDTLQCKPNQLVGKSHAIDNDPSYTDRIEAVHYALENDDGARLKDYDNADLILVGVSRCGKTPTCLYLALQFGISAANYPITEEDMESNTLPKALQAHRHKLFGLTIDSERLASIRHGRRANSTYASFEQCDYEVRFVESMLKRNRIPMLNTTHHSIEEISAKILKMIGFDRQTG